jgi:hypothetical protein
VFIFLFIGPYYLHIRLLAGKNDTEKQQQTANHHAGVGDVKSGPAVKTE